MRGKVILVPKEHDKYVHLCGRTGMELEELMEIGDNFCDTCPDLKKCLRTHSVPEWETIPATNPGEHGASPSEKGEEISDSIRNYLPRWIQTLDADLKNIDPVYYRELAKFFEGTVIEKIIFAGDSFQEQAAEHCRDEGWKEPQ